MSTQVSNPYSFDINKNYNSSTNINFKSNFSFICDIENGAAGYDTYGLGTLVYNNTGINIVELIALTNKPTQCRWSNKRGGYATITIKIKISSGQEFVIGKNATHCPELYNYIYNNIGKQLYFYIYQ